MLPVKGSPQSTVGGREGGGLGIPGGGLPPSQGFGFSQHTHPRKTQLLGMVQLMCGEQRMLARNNSLFVNRSPEGCKLSTDSQKCSYVWYSLSSENL